MAAALSRALKLPGKMLFTDKPASNTPAGQSDRWISIIYEAPFSFALPDVVLRVLFDHVMYHTYIRVFVYKCRNTV